MDSNEPRTKSQRIGNLIDVACATLYSSAHSSVSSSDRENLQLYGAWIQGAGDMSIHMLASMDSLKESFGEGEHEIALKLVRFLSLKTAYTFLRLHPDFSPLIGEGDDRETFLLGMVGPLITSWWENDSDRRSVFKEFLSLDLQFQYDENYEKTEERNLIYRKTLAICSGVDIDYSELQIPITDVIHRIATGGISLPLAERFLYPQAEKTGFDAVLETFRYWPSNWPYNESAPRDLFEGPPDQVSNSQPSSRDVGRNGGCLGILLIGVFSVVTFSLVGYIHF